MRSLKDGWGTNYNYSTMPIEGYITYKLCCEKL